MGGRGGKREAVGTGGVRRRPGVDGRHSMEDASSMVLVNSEVQFHG